MKKFHSSYKGYKIYKTDEGLFKRKVKPYYEIYHTISKLGSYSTMAEVKKDINFRIRQEKLERKRKLERSRKK
jgi:hypothetical protein